MKRLTGLTLLLCFAPLSGCGEKLTELSGKVTMNDKPLTGGAVVFVTEDSKSEHVPIQPDGTYSSKTIPVGKLRIGIVPPPNSSGTGMPKGVKLPPGVPTDSPQAKLYLNTGTESVDIPAALRDPATSNITINADGSQKTFDIPLKSP